ncbi:MAG: hypothetical protein JO149_04705 [Gammaproteobacteria bacterium]|nr:hypothetical protein [Gammaproteobacteria bacterium]
MKKLLFTLLLISLSPSLYANWYESIFRSELRMEGLQGGILDKQGQMLDVERNMLNSQQDIDSLMHDVNRNITGNSGWGNYRFHDYQSYGGGANDWSAVMQMAENGRGDGELGQTMGGLSNQFPANKNIFNDSDHDEQAQKYYALQTQTILAVRSASHLDYNKIQDQIQYQQMLQQQIEMTKDLKAAVDLNNRIQVEGNLILLEILRQVVLLNQQQAITEQATVNVALSNAKFLTK